MNTAVLSDAILKNLVVDIDLGRCRDLNTETIKKVLGFFHDTAEVKHICSWFSLGRTTRRTENWTDRRTESDRWTHIGLTDSKTD